MYIQGRKRGESVGCGLLGWYFGHQKSRRFEFCWQFCGHLIFGRLLWRPLKNLGRHRYYVGIFNPGPFETRPLQCIKYVAHSYVSLRQRPLLNLPCSAAHSASTNTDPVGSSPPAPLPRKVSLVLPGFLAHARRSAGSLLRCPLSSQEKLSAIAAHIHGSVRSRRAY